MRKLAMMVVAGVLAVIPQVSFAVWSAGQSGLGETAKEATLVDSEDAAYTMTLPMFIGKFVIAPIMGITATLIFALMVYAGFLWMTAQGDGKKVQKAKDILTQCIVGAVVLVGAYALANFVITAVTTGAGA